MKMITRKTLLKQSYNWMINVVIWSVCVLTFGPLATLFIFGFKLWLFLILLPLSACGIVAIVYLFQNKQETKKSILHGKIDVEIATLIDVYGMGGNNSAYRFWLFDNGRKIPSVEDKDVNIGGKYYIVITYKYIKISKENSKSYFVFPMDNYQLGDDLKYKVNFE